MVTRGNRANNGKKRVTGVIRGNKGVTGVTRGNKG